MKLKRIRERNQRILTDLNGFIGGHFFYVVSMQAMQVKNTTSNTLPPLYGNFVFCLHSLHSLLHSEILYIFYIIFLLDLKKIYQKYDIYGWYLLGRDGGEKQPIKHLQTYTPLQTYMPLHTLQVGGQWHNIALHSVATLTRIAGAGGRL